MISDEVLDIYIKGGYLDNTKNYLLPAIKSYFHKLIEEPIYKQIYESAFRDKKGFVLEKYSQNCVKLKALIC